MQLTNWNRPIRSAYNKVRNKSHPDKKGGSNNIFNALNIFYDTILNPDPFPFPLLFRENEPGGITKGYILEYRKVFEALNSRERAKAMQSLVKGKIHIINGNSNSRFKYYGNYDGECHLFVEAEKNGLPSLKPSPPDKKTLAVTLREFDNISNLFFLELQRFPEKSLFKDLSDSFKTLYKNCFKAETNNGTTFVNNKKKGDSFISYCHDATKCVMTPTSQEPKTINTRTKVGILNLFFHPITPLKNNTCFLKEPYIYIVEEKNISSISAQPSINISRFFTTNKETTVSPQNSIVHTYAPITLQQNVCIQNPNISLSLTVSQKYFFETDSSNLSLAPLFSDNSAMTCPLGFSPQNITVPTISLPSSNKEININVTGKTNPHFSTPLTAIFAPTTLLRGNQTTCSLFIVENSQKSETNSDIDISQKDKENKAQEITPSLDEGKINDNNIKILEENNNKLETKHNSEIAHGAESFVVQNPTGISKDQVDHANEHQKIADNSMELPGNQANNAFMCIDFGIC